MVNEDMKQQLAEMRQMLVVGSYCYYDIHTTMERDGCMHSTVMKIWHLMVTQIAVAVDYHKDILRSSVFIHIFC